MTAPSAIPDTFSENKILYRKEMMDGIEIFVLDGGFDEGSETFGRRSWLRLPKGTQSVANTGPEGTRVWIKRDHLRETPKAPAL